MHNFQVENDQHPVSNLAVGEKLLYDTYTALRTNQAVWDKSLLVIKPTRPTDSAGNVGDYLATLSDPDRYHNPWHSLVPAAPAQEKLMTEPQYFFRGDGSLALLLARPIQEAGSFTAAAA